MINQSATKPNSNRTSTKLAVVRTGNSKILRAARCRIDLKLTLSDERLFTRTTYKIGQIAHLLATRRWQTAFLRVRYGGGFDNAATAGNLDDALYHLNAFTETEQLEHMTNK